MATIPTMTRIPKPLVYQGPIHLNDEVMERLAEIRSKAAFNVVDAQHLHDFTRLNAQASLAHKALMQTQSTIIPPGFTLVYSMERHPPLYKQFRHLSLSSPQPDKVPGKKTAWRVAQVMGFVGELTDCSIVWVEQLSQGMTIQLLQALIGPGIDQKPIVRQDRDVRMCTGCGALNTAETAMTEKGAKPSEGDISICFSCGLVSQMQNGMWEARNAEQIAALDPEMQLEIKELTETRIKMFGTTPLNQQHPNPKEGNV